MELTACPKCGNSPDYMFAGIKKKYGKFCVKIRCGNNAIVKGCGFTVWGLREESAIEKWNSEYRRRRHLKLGD